MTVSVATPVTVFQSTPSQRGRLCNADIFFTTCVFQSTPSQRGRRLLTVLKTVADTISIHALAKRATSSCPLDGHCVKISIHALAKRATLITLLTFQIINHFNPRPRKEGDCHFAFCKLPNIHFNPRPRKEGDKALMQRAIL